MEDGTAQRTWHRLGLAHLGLAMMRARLKTVCGQSGLNGAPVISVMARCDVIDTFSNTQSVVASSARMVMQNKSKSVHDSAMPSPTAGGLIGSLGVAVVLHVEAAFKNDQENFAQCSIHPMHQHRSMCNISAMRDKTTRKEVGAMRRRSGAATT